jgi:NADH-quinone oxidoreductase subunit M
MFAHGVNVIGLWIVADVIEQKTGTRKFSELGGLAQKAPTLAILFAVMAFANIALPLTNAFIGEFMMFNALFQYNIWFASVALISIILAAVYTLWMVQKIFFGDVINKGSEIKVPFNTHLMLAVLVGMILFFGVYPKPMINLTNNTSIVVAQNK